MRVLMCQRVGGAFGYITDSWINALHDKGHHVRRWDGHDSSWLEFKPDLYIGCSGHRQPIPARRGDCKVAIHVNVYGPVNVSGINESDDAIRWTLQHKPDAVFGYGHEDDRILWSHWTTKHGIPWIPMPTAGDRIQFKLLIADEDRPYDLVYLGGRWAYKGQTIDRFLIPVLRHPQIKSKVHGWGDWPADLCSGALADDQACKFLNSGRVGPCIAEQHSHDFGFDIPERAFKLALCGTVVIHDSVPTIRRMIPSAIVATTPEAYLDYCYRLSRPEARQERIELALQQREEVLANQTYHHRMATMFSVLGFADDAVAMLA